MKLVCFLAFCVIGVVSVTGDNSTAVCDGPSKDCSTCLSNPECFFCDDDTKPSKCMTGKIFPTDKCDLSKAKWGVCWINYQILLIVMGVLATVILLILFTCICCCCRRCQSRRARSRDLIDDARTSAEKEERNTRSSQRRAERQAKYDDIRRKYGLSRDGSGTTANYSRFENEVA